MQDHIKICGITGADDARAAVDAGADAIGLNFFPGSRRFVTVEQAERIIAAVPDETTVVGVFVDAAISQLKALAGQLRLDVIQLHGQESATIVSQLDGLPCWRAFRCATSSQAPDQAWQPITDYVEACRAIGTELEAVLLDAHVPGQWGGTGATLDWPALAGGRYQLRGPSLMLAGGLRPENVAEAIRCVQPDGVDTASGVESSPGIKDAARMADFVQRAREAFNALRSEGLTN